MAYRVHPSSGGGRGSRRLRRLVVAAGLLGASLLVIASVALGAQATVGLGTADTFAVLAGSTVTNTGTSVISGNVGLDPGSAITGFPPGIVNAGTIHVDDAVAQQAQSDLTTAYNDAAGRSSTATISSDLAGLTLTPGVYTSATSLGLSGNLTLDAQGDPSAVFIFQAGSTLTASNAQITLTGGAQACNVFWQVGSSATIGTGSQFVGVIMALDSISMNTGATLDGSALARNGAVTLQSNVITTATCATGTSGTATGGGTTTSGTTTSGTTTTGGAPSTRGATGATGAGGSGKSGASGTSTTKHHKHKKTKAKPAKSKPKPKRKPAHPTPKPATHKPPAFTG